MSRNFRFKPSLQDTKRASLAAMELMSHDGMSPAGREHLNRLRAETMPKQARGPRKPSTVPTEAETQRAIIAYLCVHPKIALVERHNSGAVHDAQKGYYIEFHHLYSRGFNGEKMRKPDICGMLKDGRYYAIEVKREGWTKPTDLREREQAAYLAHVRACGGIGIFACCVADVEVVL